MVSMGGAIVNATGVCWSESGMHTQRLVGELHMESMQWLQMANRCAKWPGNDSHQLFNYTVSVQGDIVESEWACKNGALDEAEWPVNMWRVIAMVHFMCQCG